MIEEDQTNVEPEVSEVEDIEALKQAVAEERQRRRLTWLTGREPRPT